MATIAQRHASSETKQIVGALDTHRGTRTAAIGVSFEAGSTHKAWTIAADASSPRSSNPTVA